MKMLLSYPRSGNHLFRFFIEILTETPTLGYIQNVKDIPIFQNTFPENIPFNITKLTDYDKNNLYRKFHNTNNETPTELIFIVRNPREVLLRHLNYKLIKDVWCGYNTYFNNIDFFNNFTGKKKIFYYEDILEKKEEFIKQLYDFLELKNESKLNYVLQNIDKLYENSKKGKNRAWGGVNSKSIDYYYKNIKDKKKEEFDNYIQSKIQTGKYNDIKVKYNL